MVERDEARAFGCLLEELVARCDAAAWAAHGGGLRGALEGLQSLCLGDVPAARPTFAQIAANVASLR